LARSSARPAASWFHEDKDGALTLRVHAQPGASSTGIVRIQGEGNEARVKIRLAAPAVDGKANAALRAFLADAFGVPLRCVTLVRGETGRDKTVRIATPRQRPDREWR
jgi:hypothetical protein